MKTINPTRSISIPAPLLLIAQLLTMLLAINLFASSAHAADLGASTSNNTITTIKLRSTVRISHDQKSITIADIAKVSGPQTSALKSLTVTTQHPIETDQWTTIETDTIRELIKSSPTINTGSIVLTGSSISITRKHSADQPRKPKTKRKLEQQDPEGPILKDQLTRWIHTRIGSSPEQTRIQFDDRDEQLLKTSTAGRIVEISETGRSDKLGIRFMIFENDTIVTSNSIRVDVQVQRLVRVAKAQIPRKFQLSEKDTQVESRWISLIDPIADPQKSLGLESKTSIKPGAIIMTSMLTQPVLIKRGDLVSAKSLVGRIVVTKIVRALDNGQIGDLIELESKDRKSNFTARVAGPGRVVIIDEALLESEKHAQSKP